MNKNLLYLTAKLTAAAAVLVIMLSANADTAITVVSALAFSCLSLLDFLLMRLKEDTKLCAMCAAVSAMGCFLGGAQEYMPILLILVCELVDFFTRGNMFWQISGISAALLILLFFPDTTVLAVTLCLAAMTCFCRIAIEKLENSVADSHKQREILSEQKKKLSDIKNYVKTVRQATSMEERNRFAARIHDQLGHGISGSIILLEGARLNIRKNPAQAEKSIDMATDNLRKGVDSIRMSLREERPGRAELGIHAVKAELEQFSVSYGIKTDLVIIGDLERITPQIWECAGENLIEAMTNTLKHSNADEFTLKMQVYHKIVRIEYSDNGVSEETFIKGMGIEAMEERTAASGGKCLFNKGCAGFSITTIFNI